MSLFTYATSALGGFPGWLGRFNPPTSAKAIESFSSLANGITDISVCLNQPAAVQGVGAARIALAVTRLGYFFTAEDEMAPHDHPYKLSFTAILLTQVARGVIELRGYGPLLVIPDIAAIVFRAATYKPEQMRR